MRKGSKQSLESNLKNSLAHKNEKHPNWKGDNVLYRALHRWVSLNKPKPIDGKCEICHVKPYEDLANVTGIYDRDFINWKWFCTKCHLHHDDIWNKRYHKI